MGRKKLTSEFGQGFVYNLILFAKHYERIFKEKKMCEEINKKHKIKTFNPYSNWFYGASDHLYDLKIPEQWKRTKIARLTKEMVDICFAYRLPLDKGKEASEQEFNRVIELLHQISMEIDKKLGLKVIKGDWE